MQALTYIQKWLSCFTRQDGPSGSCFIDASSGHLHTGHNGCLFHCCQICLLAASLIYQTCRVDCELHLFCWCSCDTDSARTLPTYHCPLSSRGGSSFYHRDRDQYKTLPFQPTFSFSEKPNDHIRDRLFTSLCLQQTVTPNKEVTEISIVQFMQSHCPY